MLPPALLSRSWNTDAMVAEKLAAMLRASLERALSGEEGAAPAEIGTAVDEP